MALIFGTDDDDILDGTALEHTILALPART